MADKWIWNQYWHAHRIASCFDEAGAGNYDDFIAAGWRQFFTTLPERSAALDLCTGNGAVALLAAESGRGLKIVAVDSADIDPRRFVTGHQEALAAIDFRPGINVEFLPFGDRFFDAVVSQYGIEYSDLSRSIAEIGRVIAAGGRVRLVMHAAEGSVAATSKNLIEEVDYLLLDIKLVDSALACFTSALAAERHPEGPPEAKADARAKLTTFEEALRRTGEHIGKARDPTMVRNAGATLIDLFNRRRQLPPEQLDMLVENVGTELCAHRGRLEQLLAAAVTEARAAQIAEMLRSEGANWTSVSELRAEGFLLAHIVEASF